MTAETLSNSRNTVELRAEDRTALEEAFQAMLATWSAGDAQGYAELFAPDVTYVGSDGYAFTSRSALRDSHDELFRGVLRGSSLVGEIEAVRPLGDGRVAVLHCRGAVVTRGRDKPGRRRQSVQTLVAARDGESWQFTDFHNTRYRTLPKVVTWCMRRAAAKRPNGRP